MLKKRQFWVLVRLVVITVVKKRQFVKVVKRGSFGCLLEWLKRGNFQWLLVSLKRGSFGWLLVWLKRGSFGGY